MESTLFWIGCGLGAYGVVLRQIFQRDRWVQRKPLPIILHLFFTISVGALVGFVFSASTELQGPTPKWPLVGGSIGLLWGSIQLFLNKSETSHDVLASDLEWIETSFSAILLASVIMYAVLQAFKIPSGSMENTLLIGDHLFVNKFIYGIRVPFTEKRIFRVRRIKHGDVIVFEAPQDALSPREKERHVRKDFIKRAVGLPGDVIEVKNKQLFVNGVRDENPLPVYKGRYTYPAARLALNAKEYQAEWESGGFAHLQGTQIGDNFGPIQVPEGAYFVMGDNRDNSLDSRFWGPLPERFLKGKAWIVYWPIGRVKVIH